MGLQLSGSPAALTVASVTHPGRVLCLHRQHILGAKLWRGVSRRNTMSVDLRRRFLLRRPSPPELRLACSQERAVEPHTLRAAAAGPLRSCGAARGEQRQEDGFNNVCLQACTRISRKCSACLITRVSCL